MVSAILEFFKRAFCPHLFDPPDMELRNEKGIVVWPCCICGTIFEADCGLTILRNGRCTGNWFKKQHDEEPKP